MKNFLKRCVAALAIAIAMISVVAISGCGNKNFGLGNYTYTHIHIPQNNACFKVDSWHDNDVGIEVHTDKGAMFFAEGTYVLVEGDNGRCPICEQLRG